MKYHLPINFFFFSFSRENIEGDISNITQIWRKALFFSSFLLCHYKKEKKRKMACFSMYHGRFGFCHAGKTPICATYIALVAMLAKLRKREGETSPFPPLGPAATSSANPAPATRPRRAASGPRELTHDLPKGPTLTSGNQILTRSRAINP